MSCGALSFFYHSMLNNFIVSLCKYMVYGRKLISSNLHGLIKFRVLRTAESWAEYDQNGNEN